MDGINNHYKELVISKIKELSEVYSSTIVDGVLNYFPGLDNTIVDIIKDLSKSGYIDGSIVTLNMLIKNE